MGEKMNFLEMLIMHFLLGRQQVFLSTESFSSRHL